MMGIKGINYFDSQVGKLVQRYYPDAGLCITSQRLNKKFPIWLLLCFELGCEISDLRY
ncbi:hypothetical protein J2Z60_000287 [Lactobacillus colini]|uniref:Transposase n=1 Tax=Lactobacillus colini TaxID=1819254 RepID=A0ABS4MBU0_9LACO|nr:hypothetical protein [Lactobacillus colini]MBP2057125.1 hypothetical protein [Lactobacillus colini]